MIQVYLHDLAAIDGTHKLWPQDFRALCAAVEHAIDPRSKPEDVDEFGDKIEREPEVVAANAPKIPIPDVTGEFDRSPVGALADWCQENDEPWLEKAARFLMKHTKIRIVRKHTYGTSYRFSWIDSTMPERWKYMSGDDSFAAVLANLAKEIKKRIEEIA